MILREEDQTLTPRKNIMNVLIISFSTQFQKGSAVLPNTRDTFCTVCGFPQTTLTLGRSNSHVFLSIFYAHYFFTWFSMWKFKNCRSLTIHRRKPKYTRNKYPSLPQRGVNGFASNKKGTDCCQ